MRFKASWLAISAAVLAVYGCGGGGGADSILPGNAGGVTRVVAFGDSLSDPGAYALAAIEKGGGRFSVNGPDSKVWTELVAIDYGIALLPNQVVTDAGPQRNSKGLSYAEGGARITPTTTSPIETLNGSVPFTAPTALGIKTDTVPCPTAGLLRNQFGTNARDPASATATFDPNLAGCIIPENQFPAGALPPTEDAGIGFFVSNLAGATVALVNGNPAPTRAGVTTLPIKKQVDRFLEANQSGDGKTLITYLGGANDLFVLGAAVAASAANNGPFPAPTGDFANPNATDRALLGLATAAATQVATLRAAGYSKILVGTIPNIGATPFAASQGPSGQALFGGLTAIYNGALRQAIASVPVPPGSPPLGTPNSGVAFLNLDTKFNDYLQNPAAVGVSNVTGTACRQAADGGFQSSTSIPTRKTNSSLFCNRGDLVAPNADRTFLFADGVHPTPKGHELIAEEALRVLRANNWR